MKFFFSWKHVTFCDLSTGNIYFLSTGWQFHDLLDILTAGVSYISYTQRRVQPDQCYFTVQITGTNFEGSL